MQKDHSSSKLKTFHPDTGGRYGLLISDEVKPKNGGPCMIVTGYSSGMVECRWHDGYGIKREAFREDELQPANKRQKRDKA